MESTSVPPQENGNLSAAEQGEWAFRAVYGWWDRRKNARIPGLLELREVDMTDFRSFRKVLYWGGGIVGFVLTIHALGVPTDEVYKALLTVLARI